jgi:hypothetical protein
MAFLAQHPWIAITVGTIFVVCGGLLATWGWNQGSELKYRENLIAAVVQEWRLNDHMVKEAISLARHWNAREEPENFSYRPYKTARLNALISSGIFGEEHKSLVSAVQNYESAIGDMMAYLRIAGRHNPGIFIRVELIHNPPDEMPENESDLLSQSFISVLKEHRHLGDVLAEQYSTVFD